jgi:hypothetical protein
MIKSAGNEYNIPMTEKLAKLSGQQNQEQASEEQPEEKVSENANEPEPILEPEGTNEWIDDRNFFQKYTPLNIAREIKKKLVS